MIHLKILGYLRDAYPRVKYKPFFMLLKIVKRMLIKRRDQVKLLGGAAATSSGKSGLKEPVK
jgi:hypothetical protein